MFNKRSRTAFIALITGASLSVFVTACGGDSNSADKFSGEDKAVAQAVEDFVTAIEDENGKKICDELIGGELKKLLLTAGEATCISAFESGAKDKNVPDTNVTEVKVTGNTATAKAESSEEKLNLKLVKEKGAWKISELPQAN